ncbi:MAG: hypothetical protein FWC09_04810 [Lachnospiraceae bacterium]|nr:hypothetical protein [Lachnospiraceae bacterium]
MNCCYNRPYDNQELERIHLESEIILMLLQKAEEDAYDIIGSDIISIEIGKIKDREKRLKVKTLYEIASLHIDLTDDTKNRALQLQSISNIRLYDSLHIASAEKAMADIMFTTDDRLEKACEKLDLNVRVINPVKWFLEVSNNE